MPKIEIEESELADLKRVQGFASAALANPKTRQTMLRVQKELNPDSVIPELDAAEGVLTQVRGVEEKLDALNRKLDERAAKDAEDRVTAEFSRKIASGREYLTKSGYGADGIAKIEALMDAEGIVSYPAAMAYFEKLNPPQAPSDVSRAGRFNDLSGNDVQAEDFKGLWDSQGQSDTWLDQSIQRVRNEFRN